MHIIHTTWKLSHRFTKSQRKAGRQRQVNNIKSAIFDQATGTPGPKSWVSTQGATP